MDNLNYKSMIRMLVIVPLLMIGASCIAQDDLVKINFKHTPVLQKGDTLTIEATLSIQENYHLYAPNDYNRQAGVKVTEFKLDPKLPVGLSRCGSIKTLTKEGLEPLMDIRGEGNRMIQQFIYKGGNPAKEIIIKGSFVYQVCDETTCYPPVSFPIECKIKLK